MIELTDTDDRILTLLRANARLSVTQIAQRLRLTPSLVRRRIAYLEHEDVILRYTAVIDHTKIGRRIEAYLLLRVDIQAELEEVLEKTGKVMGVRESATLAGDDADALIRLRVEDVIELRKAVLEIRKLKGVTGTKTLVALGRNRHIERESDGATP